MAGPTVYTHVADGFDFASGGPLFAGKKFFVNQRVPLRNRLLGDIRANGGEIVRLEKLADYKIADHIRRDCPPGTISYEFVTKSIQDGVVRDPEGHRAGPPEGEARAPGGSTHQPARSRRAAYTAEEDRILYQWVCDSIAGGGRVGGNEIYKQLAAKHPRHTWQSWRDRYHKQLKNRPPSAFNMPDNAPPSPPADPSNAGLARGPPATAAAKQPTPQPEQPPAATQSGGKGKTRAKGDCSVNELEAMFSADNWLELYANVDIIDQNLSDQELYIEKWSNWAEFQGNQTAEQWRQYYEKIVRPTWQTDSPGKRAEIKRKVQQMHDESSSSQAPPSNEQHHPEADKPEKDTVEPTDASLEGETVVEGPSAPAEERAEAIPKDQPRVRVSPAYTRYAGEKKWDVLDAQPGLDYTALHRFLLTDWDSLPDEQKTPYVVMDAALTKRHSDRAKNLATVASDLKTLSSSTARNESPDFYKAQLETFMKRVRDDDDTEEQEEAAAEAAAEAAELSRPVKRLKNASATPTRDNTEQQPKLVGTHDQPLEISSAVSSLATSQSETALDYTRDEGGPEMVGDLLEPLDDDAIMVQHDEQEADEGVQSSIESDDFLDSEQLSPPPPGYEAVSDNDLPADSPTPRASRQKASNFDTQAILSSPIQELRDGFPQPDGYAHDVGDQQKRRSSSPAQQLPSDASTTQSLEDFRRSLNEEDLAQLTNSQLPPVHHRTSPSPSPAPSSSTSSTNSGDPDPPLAADELNSFFDEQLEQGFSDDFIVGALRRTRLRPELTVKVLDAWREGQPLPFERGIWSVEDDAAVESGDGLELAKLERKHTCDGWGGITERMLFLEANRSL